MAITAAQVQQAYLSYFGRPADAVGLNYWMTSDVATMDAGFAASELRRMAVNNPESLLG